MVTGEVRIIGADLADCFLLPVGATGPTVCCGSTGSSGFDVNAVAILSVLRGTKKSLVGTTSADWSCGRATVESIGIQRPFRRICFLSGDPV
jgi:hypothetical protein